MTEAWYVYILRCADGTYYVGHIRDVASRLELHNVGRAASHTAARRPVHLLYSEPHPSRQAAADRERQLKRWSHAKKTALIERDVALLHRLSRSND